MTTRNSVRVVDLFAGPGGLGEGFSSYELSDGDRPFRIVLSIEKDITAHQTLHLRSFFRQFAKDRVPDAYYDALRNPEKPLRERLKALFDAYPDEASRSSREAWCAELGKQDSLAVHDRIAGSLDGTGAWLLIGGPPCQAYSLAGRSRNKGKLGYKPEDDDRQFLYVEYLQVIAEHCPAVFVMENVKGLLSATVQSQRIFERIVEDLRNPVAALQREERIVQRRPGLEQPSTYEVFSLVQRGMFDGGDLRDSVVKMEHYGVPQARHRLILIGVRSDLVASHKPGVLEASKAVNARLVLDGLPRLRSGLSRLVDSPDSWRKYLQSTRNHRWFSASLNKAGEGTYRQLVSTLDALEMPRKDRGGEFVECEPSIGYEPDWYLDQRLGGACNHSTRGHIVKDLYRYLYAACYGKAEGRSPVLADFPADLLPDHENVEEALEGGTFEDRFRVQLASRPATTITSHIAKDGHYYIHYDPTQCRSLTVREAARLQTFPDNYFFCGPRTAQYVQVGNAVPPLLARQIAAIVWDLLDRSGVVG